MSVVTKDVKVGAAADWPMLLLVILFTFVHLCVSHPGFKQCFACPCYNSVLVLLPGLAFTGLLIGGGVPMLFLNGDGGGDKMSRHVGRTLLSTDLSITWDSMTIIGYILGCISGLLYVTSRLPQIIKNVS